MNWPWITAGILAWAGTVIHAVGGEKIVFSTADSRARPAAADRDLSRARTLSHTTWHLASAAFAVLGTALFICGVIGGDAATRGAARVAAASFSAFAAVVVTSAVAGGSRNLWRHPAPFMLTFTAALAWWGISA